MESFLETTHCCHLTPVFCVQSDFHGRTNLLTGFKQLQGSGKHKFGGKSFETQLECSIQLRYKMKDELTEHSGRENDGLMKDVNLFTSRKAQYKPLQTQRLIFQAISQKQYRFIQPWNQDGHFTSTMQASIIQLSALYSKAMKDDYCHLPWK